MNGIKISVLSKKEVLAHDSLITLFGLFSKLTTQSQLKVIDRWEMLKMMDEEEKKLFLKWFERVNK